MSSSTNLEKSKPERERQDWGIVLFILLMGFLCVIVAAQWALHFSPSWTLNADMESNIDLNSEFLTSKPVVFFEPVDPAILTQPGWMAGFLTPGASYSTGTPLAASVPTSTALTEPAPTLIPTNTIPVTYTSTAVPTNTLVWLPLPATSTRRPPNTSVPPTNTSPPPPSDADLVITLDDSADFYIPGDIRTYTITVSNLIGPGSISGVTVTNSLLGPGSSVSWSCVAAGTLCGAGGPGDINDVVDLPFGSSIIYTVDVIAAGPGADIVNTASLLLPPGAPDPNLGNNADDDTDTLFVVPGAPPPSLVTYDNSCDYSITAGDPPITFSVSAAIDDDGTPDLIYYEEPQVPGILMDKIVIEISDGLNWYPLLNWGDNASNAGTNLPSPSDESDNFPIDGATLYNNTGILIYTPASLQNGPISYIRITVLAEGPPADGNVCLDALVPYP